MKKVRKGVFETNSSSMHSVSFGSMGKELLTSAYVGKNYLVEFGEYGWEQDTLETQQQKLSYMLTMSQYFGEHKYVPYDTSDREAKMYAQISSNKYIHWILEMLKDVTGEEHALPEFTGEELDSGYVDHNSHNLFAGYYKLEKDEFKEKVKEVIFSWKCTITTDNDNH